MLPSPPSASPPITEQHTPLLSALLSHPQSHSTSASKSWLGSKVATQVAWGGPGAQGGAPLPPPPTLPRGQLHALVLAARRVSGGLLAQQLLPTSKTVGTGCCQAQGDRANSFGCLGGGRVGENKDWSSLTQDARTVLSFRHLLAPPGAGAGWGGGAFTLGARYKMDWAERE